LFDTIVLSRKKKVNGAPQLFCSSRSSKYIFVFSRRKKKNIQVCNK